MEYIFLLALIVISTFFSVFIINRGIPILKKLLVNIGLMLVSGLVMFATGVQETSLLIYVIIFLLTLLGVLMRLLAPIILNLIGSMIAKIQKQPYTDMSYEGLMNSGHRMYFFVVACTTLKVLLYVALVASFLGLI